MRTSPCTDKNRCAGPGSFDPAQVSRAVPCGLVGDVGTIVRVSVRALGDGRQDRSVCSPVDA